MSRQKGLFGLAAEFDSAERLIEAAKGARDAGYRKMDAYSPIPVHGLGEVLDTKTLPIAAAVLCGSLLGGLGGYFMEWFSAVIDYPINVGGRPFHSWPSFIPLSFELTILLGGLSAFLAFFFFNGLPRPYHPLFNLEVFARASKDRFFLAIEAADPMFSRTSTREFLKRHGALEVHDVPT